MPFQNGNTPWNKGKTGLQIAWNKGLKTGLVPPNAFKKGHSFWIGKKRTLENRLKIGILKTGNTYMRGRKSPSSGPNHPNWKGGITPILEKLRKTFEYEEWRKSVFERDDYTCQECKVVGGILEADHIKPFALFPALRFELSNGRTLCQPCHRKTKTYGRRVFLRAE